MELKAGVNRVIFTSVGTKIVGNLYVPEDLTAGKKYSALVTGGPLATVKEQAHGKFANKVSQRGFVTLAFDYRNFGESDGDIPFFENPALKSEDIQSAVCFLQTLEFVDEEKIGALGICASSSYIASALMGEKRIKAFATVSAHFSLYEFFVKLEL